MNLKIFPKLKASAVSYLPSSSLRFPWPCTGHNKVQARTWWKQCRKSWKSRLSKRLQQQAPPMYHCRGRLAEGLITTRSHDQLQWRHQAPKQTCLFLADFDTSFSPEHAMYSSVWLWASPLSTTDHSACSSLSISLPETRNEALALETAMNRAAVTARNKVMQLYLLVI